MYKKLALAAVIVAAVTMLGFGANEWIPIEQLAGQGVYVVKSIEHNPEGTVLREIRIDLQSPRQRDVAWYAGDSMDRFSLRGNPRDVRLGSRLVCSKETKVRLLTHKEIPGSERYRCSTDIEGPGNRRVFSFVAY